MSGPDGGLTPELEAWIGRWAAIRASRCHPRVLEWQGPERTRSKLERSLRGELSWLGKPEVRKGYAEACPVDGAGPGDYGIRWLQLPGAGALLAGIHFYGLDLKRPFVHLSALDFELEDDVLPELRKLLRREFEVFRPTAFRVWVEGEGGALATSEGVEVDGFYLAGSLAEIRASRPPAGRDRVGLVADPELESFPDFDACYRDYLREHPGCERWLQPWEREGLEACARVGAYYRVHVDGRAAGWIAGDRGGSRGLRAAVRMAGHRRVARAGVPLPRTGAGHAARLSRHPAAGRAGLGEDRCQERPVAGDRATGGANHRPGRPVPRAVRRAAECWPGGRTTDSSRWPAGVTPAREGHHRRMSGLASSVARPQEVPMDDEDSRWALEHEAGPRWLGGGALEMRVWAPHADRVEVEFDPGGCHELEPEPGGAFHRVRVAGPAPGDRYRLRVHSNWNDCHPREGPVLFRRDPWARETEFDSEWCRLVDPAPPPPLERPVPREELVLYELHPGTFGDPREGESAYSASARRLDHVAELGFNAIQLMPCTEFGGSWGYNPRQLLAPHGPWGRLDELKALIGRAHALGIAVIMDVVLNHGSAKRNALWNWDGYGPHHNGGIYFEGERDTPWGRRFAFHKPEVRDYLLGACRFWIEEMAVDGLRFDSAHNMPWELLQRMTWEIRQRHPGVFLVAEITPENPAVVRDAGFDACWIHSAHFDARKVLRGNGDRVALLKSLVQLHYGFPRSSSAVNSVLGSHDQCGDRHEGREDGGSHRYFVSRCGGRGSWHGRAITRAWAAVQAFARGLPMVFMGSETLQEDWWHVDERFRFRWAPVDGGDEAVRAMMRCVAAMNRLRRRCPELHGEDLRFVHEDGRGLLAWRRGPADGEHSLVVAHLGEEEWMHGYLVPTGLDANRRWRTLFHSHDRDFGGWIELSSEPVRTSDAHGLLELPVPKWSVQVLRTADSPRTPRS